MKNTKWLQPENLFIAGFALAIPGTVFSRAMLSIGMIVMVLASIWAGNWGARWRQVKANPVVWAFMLFFLLVVISGAYSSNTEFFFERLRIKLPFAFLPIAVLSFPPLSKKTYQSLWYLLFLMMVGLSIYGTVELTKNFSQIVDSYSRAGVLSLFISHIRFSLMAVIALVAGIQLYRQGFYWFNKAEKYLLLGGSIYLFFFLHLIAVRSGLLALYLIILAFGVQYIVRTKKFAWGALGLVLLVTLPIVAYYTVPTFQNKVRYMRYDMGRFMNGELQGDYSDTRRFTSMQMGIEAGRTNSFIGVGYGDVTDMTQQMYQRYHPDIDPGDFLSPHNQFIYVFAGLGFLGLLVFIGAIVLPFYYMEAWRDPMALSVNIAMVSSFFTEHTLETQIGTAVYLIFLLLALHQYCNNQETLAQY